MKVHGLKQGEWYTALIAGLLFPLHEHLKHHDSVAVRKQLEVTQWWHPAHLKELQLSRLRQLLMHAAAHVPYYRELFQARGFKPGEMGTLADLARLPLLDKSIIRTHTDMLKSEQAQGLARFNTGGSSGEPLIFYIGKERVSHDVAAKWRATRWWDVDIGDREIVVWGSPIELGAQDGIRALRDRLLRTRLLPAFEMSEKKLDGFLDEICAVRPKMLFGYPSALSHIARHAVARGRRMDGLGIKVAFVTSERLYDEQRAQISKTFGCPVANGYGGRDAGFIAHECPAGSMHITAEDIIVAIVDAQGLPLPEGEAGVIGVKLCSCGRGLPILKEIQGRSTDFVVARDGKVMHGLALIYVLRDLPWISKFKIIQENLDLTRVLIVANTRLEPQDSENIKAAFRSRLGQEVNIVVEEVTEIPAERSGKFRYVVSKIA